MHVREGDGDGDAAGVGGRPGELAATVCEGVVLLGTPITGTTGCVTVWCGVGELLPGTAAAGAMDGRCGLGPRGECESTSKPAIIAPATSTATLTSPTRMPRPHTAGSYAHRP